MIPSAAGGGYAQARRTYEQQIAKLNDFFDQARQYQKRRRRTRAASSAI